MDYLYVFLLLALVAEILGTIGGFGSSLFFVPIAVYFLGFHAALGITAVFHVSSNITKLAMFRKGMDKKLILTIGIPAILFVILGAWLSQFVDTTYLEIGLALFLIGISALLFSFRKIKIAANTFNSITGGVLSGLIAGLIGTGGAIRGITLASFGLQADIFIATSAFIDLGIDASRAIVYTYNGFVKQEHLYLIPMLLVTSIIGTYIGKLILKKMSDHQFKSIVLILVFATGVLTLASVLMNQSNL